MRLGIFGTGYAGLVTAVGLAEVGPTVTAIDKDPDIVARLSDGTRTIHEPGLQELLTANLEAGKLRFSTRAEDAMSASKIIFLCVGPPPRADGQADLSQVEEVSRTIAQQLDGYKLIVEKSTVPARTAYWIDTTIGAWLDRSMSSMSPAIRNSYARAQRSATSRSRTGSSSQPASAAP